MSRADRTTGGAATVFTPPDFAWKPDFLTMTSRCDGQSLIVSFDILNFDPEDATTASLILDRAIIEILSVPNSP